MNKETEDKIMEEIMKYCNLKERIIIRIFKKVFIKVYNISRINNINRLIG